jgi:hypothetical protein
LTPLVHDRTRVRGAAAASIKAILCLLGESVLHQCQDPISWEKLLEMIKDFINLILGHSINTGTMLVSTQDKYLSQIIALLSHWHSRMKSFTLPKIETLVGKLDQIATSTPLAMTPDVPPLFVNWCCPLRQQGIPAHKQCCLSTPLKANKACPSNRP